MEPREDTREDEIEDAREGRGQKRRGLDSEILFNSALAFLGTQKALTELYARSREPRT